MLLFFKWHRMVYLRDKSAPFSSTNVPDFSGAFFYVKKYHSEQKVRTGVSF